MLYKCRIYCVHVVDTNILQNIKVFAERFYIPVSPIFQKASSAIDR